MSKTPTKFYEKAALAAAFLLLLVLAAFFVNYFYAKYEVTSQPSYADNLPAQGEVVSVSSIDTFWQIDPDDGKIHPYATINLDPDESQSGTLRALFYSNRSLNDATPVVIGDPHTLQVTNGKFGNGTNTITIQCSDSLFNRAAFLGYKDQEHYRWSVYLREAPTGGDFSPLAHAPIKPILKEQ